MVEGSGASQSSRAVRVLSLSEEPQLGPLRANVLRHAGFEVSHPHDRREIERLLANESFEVMVVGHSIPTEHARDYAAAYRKRNPSGKVLVVSQASYTAVRAEKTIRAIDGPEVLIATIRELTKGPDEPAA